MVSLWPRPAWRAARECRRFRAGAEAQTQIPPRSPAELPTRQRIVVDATNPREHPPAELCIFAFPPRRAKADDSRRVDAEACAILGSERRRRADDVFPKADRRRALGREEMRIDDVLDRDAAKQIFVRLRVVVGNPFAPPDRRPPPERSARSSARSTPGPRCDGTIGRRSSRGFGDAVNVLRHGRDALVDPGGRRADWGLQRVTEGARGAGHDEGADAGAHGLEQ